MQDIDFDELDRAVTSASAGQAPAPTPTPATEEAVPVTVISKPAPAAPAARRSSGRFMDVVHPSSDMRGASVPERPVTPAAEPAPTNDLPDPLDFHGFTDDSTTAAAPLESPFLTDAKVEKRPLGGFPTETPVEAPALLEAPDEPLLTAETEEVKPEPTPVPEPIAEKPVIEPTPEPTPVVEDTTVPASITQQYKEQPSTTDQPSGAIFDTESYHKPLTHTPKKKSGALAIVWIAALILVGAGAGAAVYFFVLPLL